MLATTYLFGMAGDQCTLFFFCCFCLCIRVHEILDPGPGIELGPCAVEGKVLII